MALFRIIRGSALPQLQLTLKHANGTPIDLSDVSNLRLGVALNYNTANADLVIDKALTVVDADAGQCVAEWIEGDTDHNCGLYKAQVSYDDEFDQPVKIGEFDFRIDGAVETP